MNTPSAFELAGDDIIAVLLNEDEAWLECEELGLRAGHMPTPAHRMAFNIIHELRKAKQAVSDTVILDKAGGVFDLYWLSQRFALYDATRTGSVYTANIRLVLKHGTNEGIQRILNTAIDQLKKQEKPTELITGQLIDILSTVHQDTQIKGETGSAIGQDFADFMNTEPPPLLSTGLPWLDEITGGFEPHMIWWIAAAYKQRKSTLMFMLALSALLQGASVEILSREMPRRRVAANMTAMLSVAYIIRKDWYELKTSAGIPIHAISGSALMRARKLYKSWDTRKVEAIDYAIAQWNKFNDRLRIYDTTPNGGSLTDWNSVQTVFKRDQAKYGTPTLLFADYLQLFDAPGKGTYEQTAHLSRQFQTLAQHEDTTVIVLAQKNEDSIKNGGGYSPGIKGGGDPAQTADYLMITSYKQEDDDDTQLKIKMKLSRHGVGGENTNEVFNIHPSSGLIQQAAWIKDLKL